MAVGQFIQTIVLLLLVLVSTETGAANSTRYVSDQLIITLRAGQGDEFKILKSLPSGTKLELLEEVEGGDFAKVRTEDGTEGWVRRWYLRDAPTAQLLLDEATRKVAQLVPENKKLLASNNDLSQAKESLEKELGELKQKYQEIAAESDKLKEIASHPIELENENRRLTAEAEQIKELNKQLSSENRLMRQSSVQKWFLAGSCVLVFGILLGLILPRLKRHRTADW